MATPLRVVFDTNVFSPDKFHLIEQSSMRKLCRVRRIIPFYGHVFLEETFRAYGVADKRQDLVQRWLPFISATVDRFCDDFVGIWQRELVQGRGLKTNIYMTSAHQRTVLSHFPNIPLDGSWRAWRDSKKERDVENAKRTAQREVSKAIRKEVADWRKAVNYHPKRHGISRLEKYFETEVDTAGRQFIPTLVWTKKPEGVADRWSKAKMNYPYFTMFIINMLYIAHHAMTKPNERIDLNAQADLDLMTHLLRADVLVSNEAGFLRKAFEDLWRPRGKVIFTSEQFVDLIHNF